MSFMIIIDNELETNDIEKIIFELNNKGYHVEYKENDIMLFKFLLDKSFYDKSIVNAFEDLQGFKNDFMNTYKKVIFKLN